MIVVGACFVVAAVGGDGACGSGIFVGAVLVIGVVAAGAVVVLPLLSTLLSGKINYPDAKFCVKSRLPLLLFS